MSVTKIVKQVPLTRNSWLVQRLQAPHDFDNPFSFGGGLKNGGLSDDAMSLLRGIFSFDYMGSAEFEFGAVPEALQQIAADANEDTLSAGFVKVPMSKVAKPWNAPADIKVEGSATVYFLCRNTLMDAVSKRILEFAADKVRTKEIVKLNSALIPVNDWDRETLGWLELDNGFMFFTDRDMWAKTCDLFGVDTTNLD